MLTPSCEDLDRSVVQKTSTSYIEQKTWNLIILLNVCGKVTPRNLSNYVIGVTSEDIPVLSVKYLGSILS